MFILFNFPPDAVLPKLLASDFKFVLKSISGYLWDESIYVLSDNPPWILIT